MLLLSVLDTGKPIQNFLVKAVKAQDTTGVTLNVHHLCILRELMTAKYNKLEVIPMKHIETKYNIPKYIVSRNAIMLSERGVKDKNLEAGKREGKDWLRIVPLTSKNTIEGASFDTRNKGLKLTKKGENVCEILFGSLKKEL